MKRIIVLISCVSQKLPHRAKAAKLYTSTLFTYNLAYAHSLAPDSIYILSAKYGLVSLEQEIAPYDLTLNKMRIAERRAWAKQVLEQLLDVVLPGDRVVFLAGQRYREFLVPALEKMECIIEVPMEGLSIGKQLHWLKAQIGGDHDRNLPAAS